MPVNTNNISLEKIMFNPLKYFKNRSVGLVLGSGGAKGLAHISVIEYLGSMGIPIDMIAGSSIGAVIGSIYCCGRLNDFKEDMLAFSKKDMLSYFDVTLPRSGLIKGNGFTNFMKKYIPADAKIEDMKVPLAIVATDYSTGRPVVFRSGSILEALRASVSIPGILVPVAYNDSFLIDGGVARPLPVDVVKEMGAGIVVAVNLHPVEKKKTFKERVKITKDKSEKSEKKDSLKVVKYGEKLLIPVEKKISGWYSSIEQWLGSGKSGDSVSFPSIFEILSQSIDIMSNTNTERTLNYHKPAVIIEPDLLHVGTLDFTMSSGIITEGYYACSREKKNIKRRVKLWL